LDNILPAYDDPLFSLLVIILLVLIVAVSSFVMGSVKEERKRKSLERFLDKFTTKSCILEIEEMPFENTLIKPLTLLAHAFSNQGEYQKSINLNLYLIEHISNFKDKEKILEQLGQTYLKAGFLKRSESIFLEILHKHARNKNALYHLGIVYELLNEYEKALETIQPLKILEEETEALEAHLTLSKFLADKHCSTEQKVEKLVALLEHEDYAYRHIITSLFSLDVPTAWRCLQTDKIKLILDVLWFLPSSNLNLDIILSDETLLAIYLAKGSIENRKLKKKSGIFAIDTIISLRESNNFSVDLEFNYGCGKCKQHFPITFIRCPNCYAIDAIQIKEKLAKKQSQTGYSLL